MKLRYELVDTHHPDWKGQRFTSLARAVRERDRAVPPGRFVLRDRLTGEDVTFNPDKLRELRNGWLDAIAALDDTDAAEAAEEAAREALIDYVETHGLNYSEHDPRGTE